MEMFCVYYLTCPIIVCGVSFSFAFIRKWSLSLIIPCDSHSTKCIAYVAYKRRKEMAYSRYEVNVILWMLGTLKFVMWMTVSDMKTENRWFAPLNQWHPQIVPYYRRDDAYTLNKYTHTIWTVLSIDHILWNSTTLIGIWCRLFCFVFVSLIWIAYCVFWLWFLAFRPSCLYLFTVPVSRHNVDVIAQFARGPFYLLQIFTKPMWTFP